MNGEKKKNIYILDARMLGEKKQAHEYMKEVFGFPSYYGNNLDALHDCLTEIPRLKILIRNINEAGPYFLNLYPVLLRDGKASVIS